MTAADGPGFAFHDLGAAERPWRTLARSARGASALAGPDLPLAAAGTVEPPDWRVAAVEDGDGTWRAALPVRLVRLPPAVGTRIAESFRSHYGPASPLLVRDGDTAAADRLLGGLAEKAAVLRLSHQQLDAPGWRILEDAAAARGLVPLLRDAHLRAALGHGHDPRGPAFTGSALKELRRLHRRLGELGELRHEVLRDGAAVGAPFTDFLELEAGGWKGRRGTALIADPRRRAFAERLVAAHAAASGLRLDLLRLDGRPVAGLVTLMRGGAAATWKIAYDESLSRFSPGVQILRLATDGLLHDRSILAVDSLAAPGHPLADRAWGDRIPVAEVILPLRPDAARAAARVADLLQAVARLRRRASELRTRLRR